LGGVVRHTYIHNGIWSLRLLVLYGWRSIPSLPTEGFDNWRATDLCRVSVQQFRWVHGARQNVRERYSTTQRELWRRRARDTRRFRQTVNTGAGVAVRRNVSKILVGDAQGFDFTLCSFYADSVRK